jgi:hypothetical protein
MESDHGLLAPRRSSGHGDSRDRQFEIPSAKRVFLLRFGHGCPGPAGLRRQRQARRRLSGRFAGHRRGNRWPGKHDDGFRWIQPGVGRQSSGHGRSGVGSGLGSGGGFGSGGTSGGGGGSSSVGSGGAVPGTGGSTAGPDARPTGGGGSSTDSGAVGDGGLPRVYGQENTGADCPKPSLPAYAQLPTIDGLPDPFLSSSGSRITSAPIGAAGARRSARWFRATSLGPSLRLPPT